MGADADGSGFSIGDWLVEPELNRIVRGEDVVKIDPRNMRLLQLLASRPRQVISQAEIEQTVWADVVVTPNSVYQSIAQLRRALGDEKSSPRYIETIARKGYRLVAQLSGPDARRAVSQPEVPPRRSLYGDRGHRLRTAVAFTLLTAALGLSGSISRESRSQGDLILASRDAAHSALGGSHRTLLFPASTVPESPHLRVHMLAQMALVALNDGRPEEARLYAEQALKHESAVMSTPSSNAGESLTLLAYAQLWLAQYEAAEETAREALASFQSGSGVQPAKIDALRCLGSILADRGKFEEANDYLKHAIELADRLYGSQSGFAAETRADLASLRRMEGRLADSEGILRDLLENQDVLRRNRILEVLFRTQLGDTLLAQKRYQDAKAEMESTLHIASKTVREDHPYIATTRELLGRALIGLREYEEAEPLLRSAMTIWRDNGTWTWRVGRSASALGEALLGQGLIDDADRYLAYASRVLETAPRGQLEQLALMDHQARVEKLAAATKAQLPQSVTLLPALEIPVK